MTQGMHYYQLGTFMDRILVFLLNVLDVRIVHNVRPNQVIHLRRYNLLKRTHFPHLSAIRYHSIERIDELFLLR